MICGRVQKCIYIYCYYYHKKKKNINNTEQRTVVINIDIICHIDVRNTYNILKMTWCVLYNRWIRAKLLNTCRSNLQILFQT